MIAVYHFQSTSVGDTCVRWLPMLCVSELKPEWGSLLEVNELLNRRNWVKWSNLPGMLWSNIAHVVSRASRYLEVRDGAGLHAQGLLADSYNEKTHSLDVATESPSIRWGSRWEITHRLAEIFERRKQWKAQIGNQIKRQDYPQPVRLNA